MNFKYISQETPLVFPAPTSLSQPVYFNADKTKFKLLNVPSLGELRELIDSYTPLRMASAWQEIIVIKNGKCRLFANKLKNVNGRRVTDLIGNAVTARAIRHTLNEEELKAALKKLEPKSISDMYALYQLNGDAQCCVGYRYFMDVLSSSNTAYEFYGTITENLFNSLDNSIQPEQNVTNYYRARIYELLGYSVTKGFLLFPFVHASSGIAWNHHMSHKHNASTAFGPYYRPLETESLFAEISSLKPSKSTELNASVHTRNLMVASTLRTTDQASTALFQKCCDLILESNNPMSVQQASMHRATYNLILRLHNARCAGAPPQALLFTTRIRVQLDDWASFNELRVQDPRMAQWCDWFSLFVKETKDSQGQSRKTACTDFATFLLTLADPPLSPLVVTRAHINDYSHGTLACFRGFLSENFQSVSAKNDRLSMIGQLFDLVKERLLASYKGHPKDAPWLAQPVDMKLDRFTDWAIKSGTTRKCIAAHVMEEMRSVLTENDYAWSKEQGSWARLHNQKTNAIEHVWCPSATILLYTLLTLPLRSLQARLFDSGEGDPLIFDFDTCAMVPNPNQIALDGVLGFNRRECVLQVIPSGMLDVVDIVGVWVPVNKTSDKGYHIPWVSDDLLGHLRNQHEWVRQYTPLPNAHGIIAVQGHRNLPEQWSKSQAKFFCLFRDPSVRILDPSLPVSKQKLLKLWAALCYEVELRINARAKNESQRIKLVNLVPVVNPPSRSKGIRQRKKERPLVEAMKIVTLHDIHTLRVSGITDLLDRGVPLNIVSEYVAGHATYIMTLWYDKPSPGKIRQALKSFETTAGQSHAAIPKFTEAEVDVMRPYLVVNSTFEGGYTGFDALTDNTGLLQFRLAGICPGTRCEEGGITSNGRITAVPSGDRGPSCPQCRFYLTGPAFLLGQCIEGNQLILKIRKKVQSLDSQRASILEVDDAEDFARADVLRAQADLEERQLNDMLTEWWHRMKLYEASVHKLDDYRSYLASNNSNGGQHASQLMLVAAQPSDDLSFSFKRSTQLELEHFLSTCSELLPDYSMESRSTAIDLEMAVGKFLAINDQKDLVSLYFTLTDAQRLTAANLTVEMMLATAEDPSKAAELLEGKTPLSRLPDLEKGLSDMLLTSSKFKKTIPIKVQR